MDAEFSALTKEVQELRKLFESDEELRKLSTHPMLVNYTAFYERFRKVEITLENLNSMLNYFESRIQGVEQAVRSLTMPRNRGA